MSHHDVDSFEVFIDSVHDADDKPERTYWDV